MWIGGRQVLFGGKMGQATRGLKMELSSLTALEDSNMLERKVLSMGKTEEAIEKGILGMGKTEGAIERGVLGMGRTEVDIERGSWEWEGQKYL